MPTTEPWLTVATVVRNDAEALERTLDSVSAQNTTGVEHLIVDGASTDSTTQIAELRAIRDPWVRMRSEPDQGIYDAMNQAISLSRGKYIHFLNAGDIYTDSETIHWLAGQLHREPVQWLRTPVQFVDAAGQPSRPIQSVRLNTTRFVNGKQPVYHQGAIMTKSLLVELGGFDLRYPIAADFDLMRRALAMGIRPGVSDRVLVRVDDFGVSTQRWPQALREVHLSRSSAGGTGRKARSFGTLALAMATVGSRRLARKSAERLLTAKRTRKLRGLADSDPG